MKVVTTNLAIRFYKKDGWTLKLLEPLITKSGDYDEPFHYFGRDFEPYWIPKVSTRLDLNKLLAMGIEVQRTFNDYPNEDDKTFLQRFNW